MDDLKDRTFGSLVGLAVGDALGTPLEFAKRDTLAEVRDLVGGGHFNLAPGQWTDDTAMALCLADSMIQTGSFDLRDQLERYICWAYEGYFSSTGKCFGIGQQTLRSLEEFSSSGCIQSSLTSGKSSGNGSIMRLAPIPMVFYPHTDLVGAVCGASSLTTHPNTECVEACVAYGTLLAGAIQGESKKQLIDHGHELAKQITSVPVRDILAGSYLKKSREEISSSGYVVDTLNAALWAFSKTTDFASGAILAVNLAGDADTIGAVYGQLAGAHYGLSNIPTKWVQKLHDQEMIISMAQQLYELSSPGIKISEESLPLVNRISVH